MISLCRVSALLCLLSLFGCNVGLTPDKDVPDENRQEILGVYDQVEGVYEGSLTKNEKGEEVDRYDVEIRLFPCPILADATRTAAWPRGPN